MFERFVSLRRGLLNPPIDVSEHDLFRRSAAVVELYRAFNGEAFWGAWLPGCRISPVDEVESLRAATSDSWEWIEEERGSPHPLRNFLPLIMTGRKSNIGPILDPESKYFDSVIEYDYERGEVLLWSRSTRDFLEGTTAVSCAFITPDAETQVMHRFSAAEIELLSAWGDLAELAVNPIVLSAEDI